jgi:AcrR family transcriptional regulator
MVTSPGFSTAASPTSTRSRPARGPRRVPAARRRALIEEAAARLFAERGFERATVEQIAHEAGVSKPMIYRHFESKKDLCMKLLERRRDELAAAPLDEFIHGSGDPRGRLPAMIEVWFEHVEQHPYSARLLFADATGDDDIKALQRELRRRQRAADIALLTEFGVSVPEDQLEPLGEIVRSALSGLALWWLDHPGVARATVTAAMLRMTRGMLSAHEG